MKFTKPPGREYVKVICDVCSGEFYQKDTVYVQDRYNFQYGLVVCKADLDKVNPQIYPIHIYEPAISDPKTLRPEKTDRFLVNENDDRLPSAPRLGSTLVNPITDAVDLYWQGPIDNGSSGIEGYKIVRAGQLLEVFETISENTNMGATYYTDTTADVNAQYIYKVAAINSFGVGPYSEAFYWSVAPEAGQPAPYLRILPQSRVLTIGGLYLMIT
jgi:hypothetical protein